MPNTVDSQAQALVQSLQTVQADSTVQDRTGPDICCRNIPELPNTEAQALVQSLQTEQAPQRRCPTLEPLTEIAVFLAEADAVVK